MHNAAAKRGVEPHSKPLQTSDDKRKEETAKNDHCLKEGAERKKKKEGVAPKRRSIQNQCKRGSDFEAGGPTICRGGRILESTVVAVSLFLQVYFGVGAGPGVAPASSGSFCQYGQVCKRNVYTG